MLCNTAVFYDIENLICLFSVRNNTILQLDEIYRRILEVEGVSGVSVQKAYADWAVQINRNLRHYVLQIGIEPVQIFNTNQNDKVKNAADVSLIIDAVELLAKRPDIENYVVVSGDGIFAFLAKKLHEHGKRVIGCGFNRNTNIIFRNACDYFISLEKTDKTLTATSNKSVLTGPSALTIAAQSEERAEMASEAHTPATAKSQAPKPTKPSTSVLVKSNSVPASAATTIRSIEIPASATTAEKSHELPAPAVVIKSNELPAPAATAIKSIEVSAAAAAPAIISEAVLASDANASAAPAKLAKAKKAPRRFPKNKFTEALINSDIAIWKNNDDINGALLVVRDVVNTLFSNMPDEAAVLEISMFKTYVDHYVQNFKISQYNFSRFGEFVCFVLTGSPYCLYSAEGNTLKIARRGTVGNKGSVISDMRGLQITLSDGKLLHSIFDVPEHAAFTYVIVEQPKPNAKPEAKDKTPQSKPVAKRNKEPAHESRNHITETISTLQAHEDEPKETLSANNAETIVTDENILAGQLVLLDAKTEAPPEKKDTADITEEVGEGSVRKWIKANFMRLSLANALTAMEVRHLLTIEYSQKTFGVKTPVLKEVIPRSNLREQRIINGKVKYWKETFKYNGKTYLVYKEWIANLHRDRFAKWYKKVTAKTEKPSEVIEQ